LKAYCDTSFLVSLYTQDVNSASAASHARRPETTLLVTPLCELELVNALQLRLWRRELNAREVEAARAAFEEDLAAGLYAIHPVSPAVYHKARQLSLAHTRTLGSRSLDILHVAAALVVHADVLYSFDAVQRRLAAAAGLATAPKSS
jgi:predicted nucleic acid-binding protein